jgi:hypothetical protein
MISVFFFTSLIYVLLLFVLPGQWLLEYAAAELSGLVPFWIIQVVLNVVVYAGILAVLLLNGLLYKDLEMDKRPMDKLLREWLEVRGCRLLSVVGFVLLLSLMIYGSVHGVCPWTLWMALTAIGFGLWTVFLPAKPFVLLDDLPAPRFDFRGETEPPEGAVEREFKWFDDESVNSTKEIVLKVYLLSGEYEEARSRERHPTRPLSYYAKYVTELFESSMRSMAEKTRELSYQRNWTALEELWNNVVLTRSIPYESDQKTHGVPDYANYPIETVWEMEGDCEDHAILAASVLFWLGHDVALFWIEMEDSAHLALGYHTEAATGPFYCRDSSTGKKYYYIETVPTDSDNKVGDISISFLKELQEAEVVEIQRRV